MAGLVLEIVEGTGAGQQVALDATLEIGREPGVSLRVTSPEVSRRHARVVAQGGGAVVEDLDSANGTYVNEQRISTPRPVVPGDRLRVGTTVFQLRSAEQVRAQPSAVVPSPQITPADHVLAPVPDAALSKVQEVPDIPALRRPETPAAYVQNQPGGAPPAPAATPAVPRGERPAESYGAPRLEAWVDARVKRQTSVAAFALLAIACLAVVIYFGAT